MNANFFFKFFQLSFNKKLFIFSNETDPLLKLLPSHPPHPEYKLCASRVTRCCFEAKPGVWRALALQTKNMENKIRTHQSILVISTLT